MKQEVAEALLRWEDHEEYEYFEPVGERQIDGTSRWSTFYAQVYRDKRTGTFWEVSWSRGSTEMQDEGPEDIAVSQVWPHEVTTTVYKTVPPET